MVYLENLVMLAVQPSQIATSLTGPKNLELPLLLVLLIHLGPTEKLKCKVNTTLDTGESSKISLETFGPNLHLN